MTDFQQILNKKAIVSLIEQGGEVFFVGGCVRDFILGKTPKDIDMVVRNLEYEKLVNILNFCGKVDVVGESFGVIKFKEFETDFEIEFALPRVDSKDLNATGHKAIIAQSNPFLTIEDDLFRRDFTINSIALNSDLNYIDPYDGISDLKKGKIKATNKDAFQDDPLRMLRALQFASRFQFNIEQETFEMIKQQANSIKEITAERILMEFEKVFSKKGDVGSFLFNLRRTGLLKSIIGFDDKEFKYVNYISNASCVAEFLFFICAESLKFKNIHTFLQEKFKIDNVAVRICKALEKYHNSLENGEGWCIVNLNELTCKQVMFDVLQIYPLAYTLNYLEDDYYFYLNSKYPKNLNELALTGDDLVDKMGFKQSPKIGAIRKALLNEILADKIQNTYEDCFEFVSENFAVE